ncbi:hypothetical protein FB45DRAFT_931704 [Roridomyces roridus]|uniref:Uncharacterized protein n=1 Tax=Roridomyces roridus TaxID=1738132 RepID=A0AAD7BE20_9AGAR|nr:hypothetical protein FB45DRAFT_931704 [Roridomyces roridus]
MKRHGSTSASFMELYNSLPPEARQSLVEKKLAPLLDSVPKERAKKVMKSANSLQSRYSDIPVLDLKAKQKEIHFLLDELSRDSKRAIVPERSHREELLVEVVDSMVNWLNDIWTVVYEYNVHFEDAHRCLLFIGEVLGTLKTLPGLDGHCKCFSHLKVAFSIKRKGETVRKFNLAGPRHIDQALLWIWRDLFLSMFAKQKSTKRIPEMLLEIEDCLGWRALERLLYGGYRRITPLDGDYEDDYDEDDECESGVFMEEDMCLDESSVPDDSDDSDDDDSEDEDEDEDSWRCPCPLHGSHWSDTINDQRGALRDLVYDRLISIFELTPSYPIFSSIIAINPNESETESKLLDTLSEIAPSSADTLVAALSIHIHCGEGHPGTLMALLDEHSHLLRPRDAPVLQRVVNFLTQFSSYQTRALQFAEKEILSTLAAVRASVRSAFSLVEDKMQLQCDRIVLGRQQRITDWVQNVSTPGSAPAHPMALAAMLMGFPLPVDMDEGDDMDVLGFLDSDQLDLRERFDGWISLVSTLKGGNSVLGRVYVKTMEEMPYFKVNDIVEEMLSRLGERPNKVYILDAVDTVLTFAKSQRKKMAARIEKRKKNEAAKKAAAEAAAAPPPGPVPPLDLPPHINQRNGYPFSFISTSHPPGPSTSSSLPPVPGGMEDVD